MVDPLSYFSFQPVLYDWCNKDRGMCYSACGIVHIKEPLLLIGKGSLCSGGSGSPLSLSGPGGVDWWSGPGGVVQWGVPVGWSGWSGPVEWPDGVVR